MSRQTKILRSRLRDYGFRNERLLLLGFNSYGEYLNSLLWEAVRTKVLLLTPECYGCQEPATQVHHRDYSFVVLTGHDCIFTDEATLNLFLNAICSRCHKIIEYDGNGHKTSPAGASERLERLRDGMHVPVHSRTSLLQLPVSKKARTLSWIAKMSSQTADPQARAAAIAKGNKYASKKATKLLTF